jgi:phosphoglycerate dehydrogenase-like enzyme
MLALTRHVGPAFLSVREGRWEPGRFRGMELSGKTLGIVGLGPIGAEMARLGAGLGMRLLGWTRRASPARAVHGVTLVPLEELFAASDVVTLHLAYTPESHGLISRALLERLKPGARLVDNAALVELLRAGRLQGAALDVHETEPPPADDVFRTLPNVLLTPHIGYNTAEASSNMLRIAIATVEAFARGERLHVVNGV